MRMPYFLGNDYFLQMISEKTALLSKATLTVPRCLDLHDVDCCLKLEGKFPDIVNHPGSPPAPELSLDRLASRLNEHVQDCCIETLHESAIHSAYFDKEGTEVIPSSNPDSESYGSELFSQTDHSLIFVEEFSRHDESEGHAPLEEPLLSQKSKDATLLMPPLHILASRLEHLAVRDPLIKKDRIFWTEKDFFKPIYTLETSEPLDVQPSEDHFDAAQFHDMACNKQAELLMSPMVTKHIPESFKADMCELEIIQSFLTTSDDNVLSPLPQQSLGSFVDEDNIKSLAHLESSECVPNPTDPLSSFVNLNNTDLTNSSQIENAQIAGVESTRLSGLKETPVLGLKEADIPDRMDTATVQQCTVYPVVEELNLATDTDVKSNVSLLRSEEKHEIELQLWLKEKCNDEMQIPEPSMIPPENLPSVLKEATNFNSLKPDELEYRTSSVFPGPSDISIPLLHIDHTEKDLEICTRPAEEFYKEVALDMEFSDWKSWDFQPDDVPTQKQTWIGEPEKPKRKLQHQDIEGSNPLESFLFLRCEKKLKEFTSPDDKTASNMHSDAHETNMVLKDVQQGFQIKTCAVPFIGPLEDILHCLADSATPYMDYMQQAGHLRTSETLMSISIDSTRFWFKESEKRAADQKDSENADLQNALCLHTLRVAADFLVNASLEACCAYLVSQQEHWKQYFRDKLEAVIKRVYQMQGEALKNNILHPKQEYLWLEVNRLCTRCCGSKILVVVPRGLPNLQESIKSMLSSVPQLAVAVLPDFRSRLMENQTGNMVCIIQYVESMPATCLSQFSEVIQYDDGSGDFFKTACKNQECSYIGLLTELVNLPTDKGTSEFKSFQTPFTLICSSAVSHNKQLLYQLESRYNIFVIERDFSKLQAKGWRNSYADVTFSQTHGAVLLSLIEMDQGWNMERAVKRYLALGLQYSHIFIIAHAIGLTTGYPLGKEVVTNIHKLRASLSNLTRASDFFIAHYKILIRLTETDVASSIRSLANSYMCTQKEIDTERSWLSADMSQQEERLLMLPCLNPFSAQVLLQKFKCRDVLQMSVEDMKNAKLDLPESTLQFLRHIASEWQLTTKNGSNISQTLVNTNLTMEIPRPSFDHSANSSKATCGADEEGPSLATENLPRKRSFVANKQGQDLRSFHSSSIKKSVMGVIAPLTVAKAPPSEYLSVESSHEPANLASPLPRAIEDTSTSYTSIDENNLRESAQPRSQNDLRESAQPRSQNNLRENAQPRSQNDLRESAQPRSQNNLRESAQLRSQNNLRESAQPRSQNDLRESAQPRSQNHLRESAQPCSPAVHSHTRGRSLSQEENREPTEVISCADPSFARRDLVLRLPDGKQIGKSNLAGDISTSSTRLDSSHNTRHGKEMISASLQNNSFIHPGIKYPSLLQHYHSEFPNPGVSSRTNDYHTNRQDNSHDNGSLEADAAFVRQLSTCSQEETAHGLMKEDLKKNLNKATYKKSNFVKSISPLHNLEPFECDQFRSKTPCLDSRQENAPLQRTENYELPLLMEPESQERCIRSSDRCRDFKESLYEYTPDKSFLSCFQEPFDTFHIKQEPVNIEDAPPMGQRLHYQQGNKANEKCFSDCVNQKNARNSYGIFSSVVRRHEHTLKKENDVEADSICQTISKPESIFEHPEQDHGISLHVGNSALPFSVSKALKKYISQAERQDVCKVPEMFQIAQSAGAVRSNRLTKQFDMRRTQNQIPLQEKPLEISSVGHHHKERHIYGHPLPNVLGYRTNMDTPADQYESRKFYASREFNGRELCDYPNDDDDQYHSITPSDLPSCTNLQPLSTNQVWRDSRNTGCPNLQYVSKSVSCAANETSQLQERDENRASTGFIRSSIPRHGGDIQYEEPPPISQHFYDPDENSNAPMYVREERLFQPRQYLEDRNKSREYFGSVIKGVRSPYSSYDYITSPTDTELRQRKMASDLLQRDQSGYNVNNALPASDKGSRNYTFLHNGLPAKSSTEIPGGHISKWRKYESDIEDRHTTQSRLYNKGISAFGKADSSPNGHNKGTDRRYNPIHCHTSINGSSDLSPPVDMSYSPEVHPPKRLVGSAYTRTLEEDSKLKRWQLYLQRQSFASQREEN